MDIESLQKSDRRRGSCLDVFLVVSIISLFVSVAAVIAGGVMVVRDLQSKVDSSRKPLEFESSKSRGDTPSQEYKVKETDSNYVHKMSFIIFAFIFVLSHVSCTYLTSNPLHLFSLVNRCRILPTWTPHQVSLNLLAKCRHVT